MLKIIALMILLAAPQLDPSLTPQKAAKPNLPKIDEKACPFEGCQFGAWTATDPIQLFSTWKEDRKPVVMVSKGEAVTAITGVHITFEPSEIQVTAPIADYGLKPGDTIFGYMYKGEGVFSAWFNGYWVEDFDGSGVADAGCSRKCKCEATKGRPRRMVGGDQNQRRDRRLDKKHRQIRWQGCARYLTRSLPTQFMGLVVIELLDHPTLR